MERRIGKWIAAAAALLLVAAIGFVCAAVYRSEQQEKKAIAQQTEYFNRKLTEFRTAERKLTEQLTLADAEQSQISGGITAGVLCTEPDPRILTDILPRMEKAGYPGMVAVRTDALPDDPGCLTLEEIYTLIGNGWGICLSVTDGTDVEALYRTAADFGLTPMAAYFPETGCTAETEQRLAALGIGIVMQRTAYQPQNGVSVRTCGVNTSGVENALLDAVSENFDFVLTVGYRGEEDLFSQSGFDEALAALARCQSDAQLRVNTADAAAADRLLWEQKRAEADRALEEKREGIRKSLEAIRQQIREIGQNP